MPWLHELLALCSFIWFTAYNPNIFILSLSSMLVWCKCTWCHPIQPTELSRHHFWLDTIKARVAAPCSCCECVFFFFCHPLHPFSSEAYQIQPSFFMAQCGIVWSFFRYIRQLLNIASFYQPLDVSFSKQVLMYLSDQEWMQFSILKLKCVIFLC